jgi:hypothetical protein
MAMNHALTPTLIPSLTPSLNGGNVTPYEDACASSASRTVALVMCNANAVRDDGWAIQLDGAAIGTYNINTDTNDAVLWLPMSLSGLTLSAGIYAGCSVVRTQYGLTALDPISRGIHTLTFTKTVDNGSGNLFTVNAVSVGNVGGTVQIVTSACFNGQSLASVSGPYMMGTVLMRTFTV